MNKRDYFLACLNVQLSVDAQHPRYQIAAVQALAWAIPEEAIPEDPAGASLEFYRYEFVCGTPKPEWIERWEESKERR